MPPSPVNRCRSVLSHRFSFAIFSASSSPTCHWLRFLVHRSNRVLGVVDKANDQFVHKRPVLPFLSGIQLFLAAQKLTQALVRSVADRRHQVASRSCEISMNVGDRAESCDQPRHKLAPCTEWRSKNWRRNYAERRLRPGRGTSGQIPLRDIPDLAIRILRTPDVRSRQTRAAKAYSKEAYPISPETPPDIVAVITASPKSSSQSVIPSCARREQTSSTS
jgi:hypothetical protein